ncbi:hypothetical protein [Agromyces sp. LHK192]|uniref:hypothetical protein n=1 Tax=Agromyces sp. LHK192 TaxID=2498704 RepID=UPI000FDC62F1|nr:hypothetical protein [Agromyces sp. LHK192]
MDVTGILPVIASVVVAAALSWVLPQVRWARWLKRDLDIYSALPDGPEKERWQHEVEWQAIRLRSHREEMSSFDSVVGVAFMYGAIVITWGFGGLVLTEVRQWAANTAASGDAATEDAPLPVFAHWEVSPADMVGIGVGFAVAFVFVAASIDFLRGARFGSSFRVVGRALTPWRRRAARSPRSRHKNWHTWGKGRMPDDPFI